MTQSYVFGILGGKNQTNDKLFESPALKKGELGSRVSRKLTLAIADIFRL